MIKCQIVFGDLDLIAKVTTEKNLLNLRQKLLKLILSSDQVSGFYPNLHGINK